MVPKSLACLALLVSSATSSILPRQYLDPEIPKPGEQSCVRQWYQLEPMNLDSGYKLCFTTFVGAIYDNGRGCPGILDALNADYSPDVVDWRCERGPSPLRLERDITALHFCCVVGPDDLNEETTRRVGATVDKALDRIYAGVIDGFNCGT